MKRPSKRQITKDDPDNDSSDDNNSSSDRDPGHFNRAPPEVLATRRILKVRRTATTAATATKSDPASNPTPFAALSSAASTAKQTPPAPQVEKAANPFAVLAAANNQSSSTHTQEKQPTINKNAGTISVNPFAALADTKPTPLTPPPPAATDTPADADAEEEKGVVEGGENSVKKSDAKEEEEEQKNEIGNGKENGNETHVRKENEKDQNQDQEKEKEKPVETDQPKQQISAPPAATGEPKVADEKHSSDNHKPEVDTDGDQKPSENGGTTTPTEAGTETKADEKKSATGTAAAAAAAESDVDATTTKAADKPPVASDTDPAADDKQPSGGETATWTADAGEVKKAADVTESKPKAETETETEAKNKTAPGAGEEKSDATEKKAMFGSSGVKDGGAPVPLFGGGTSIFKSGTVFGGATGTGTGTGEGEDGQVTDNGKRKRVAFGGFGESTQGLTFAEAAAKLGSSKGNAVGVDGGTSSGSAAKGGGGGGGGWSLFGAGDKTSSGVGSNGNGTRTESSSSKAGKQQEKVETGEEGEEDVFRSRAKLYVLEGKGDKARWRERGVGALKVKRDPGTEAARVVMRTEATLIVVLNSPLFPGVVVDRASERSVRFQGFDHSGRRGEGKEGEEGKEGGGEDEKRKCFLVRFATKDVVAAFERAVEEWKKSVGAAAKKQKTEGAEGAEGAKGAKEGVSAE